MAEIEIMWVPISISVYWWAMQKKLAADEVASNFLTNSSWAFPFSSKRACLIDFFGLLAPDTYDYLIHSAKKEALSKYFATLFPHMAVNQQLSDIKVFYSA